MKPIPITISSEFIKLDALLKLANIAASGGEAKIMLLEEKIRINKEIETRRGRKIYPGDTVTLDDKIITVSK